MKAVLEAGGTSIANVVRVGVYLRDMADFEAAPPHGGVNVEIEAPAAEEPFPVFARRALLYGTHATASKWPRTLPAADNRFLREIGATVS